MRDDISEFLVHFTRGDDDEGAFGTLQKIIADRKLIGGREKIKGKFSCVCFSEAPTQSVGGGLTNLDGYSRYSLFGIQVSKKWLFEQGGRPVIYQPEADFRKLPDDMRWRHMRYELRDTYEFTDFSWEREWRIHADEFHFDESVAQIIVPNQWWSERLWKEHDDAENYKCWGYSTFMDESIANMYYENFRWSVLALEG